MYPLTPIIAPGISQTNTLQTNQNIAKVITQAEPNLAAFSFIFRPPYVVASTVLPVSM
ncbi:MAG: hypothetical protein ACI9A2_004572 [Halioglobus sp.]|jgi:hypothetical protein